MCGRLQERESEAKNDRQSEEQVGMPSGGHTMRSRPLSRARRTGAVFPTHPSNEEAIHSTCSRMK